MMQNPKLQWWSVSFKHNGPDRSGRGYEAKLFSNSNRSRSLGRYPNLKLGGALEFAY